METPATIRRNPPRKAKLTSAEKSTVKEYRTARKRYAAEGKTLLPSFTEADGDGKVKLTEETSCIETLQADSVLHGMHTYGTESYEYGHSASECSNAAEQVSSIRNSVEKISTSGIVNLETEHSLFEDPFARKTIKQASNKVHVFLRIRPAQVVRAGKGHIGKVQKVSEIANRSLQQGLCPPSETRISLDVPGVCLQWHIPDHVILVTPAMYSGLHKPKEEDFKGFSRIFNPDSTQIDVFDEVLAPRLADLLEGESSLVVAMGPTSAGKTHTMLGSHADPGLVPQSLHYLFASQKSRNVATSMKLVISMFEIYSEQGGRPEKIFDLLQDGAELSLQQSKIKGLHEAVASTAEEADEIFKNGLQRRTTASTAANYQSSRSHCIFNISICQEIASTRLKHGTLTIADLAGFEREKKTKNQGVRLSESSFINNTSMVFGQCLRALLEHQKNPKKTLQRHFQYSMLTRYLKPYMEANGSMTLIVNVSPCEKDYLDTAFVLRQVAPYSKIRVLSMLTDENFKGLRVEKRSLSVTERLQPTMKRRKMDGAMSKNIDVYNHAKIRKSKKDLSVPSNGFWGSFNEVCISQGEEADNTVDDSVEVAQTGTEIAFPLNTAGDWKADPSNSSRGLFNEVCTSQVEGADHTVNDRMEASRTGMEVASPLNTVGDWKASLVTEVNHILIQEGVENFDQISQAIMRILDNGGHYHSSEDLDRRLQEQHSEITFLRNSFLKEQQHASDLVKEVEHLKKQCKELQNHIVRQEENNSLLASSGKTCSVTKSITQSNAEGQLQCLKDKVLDQDMNESFSLEKLHDQPNGLNEGTRERSKDSNSGLSMISLSHKELQTVDSEKNLRWCEKVHNVAFHSVAVPFCTDNEQAQGLIICDGKGVLDVDVPGVPIMIDSECLKSEKHLEQSRETQVTSVQACEDGEYCEQQEKENWSFKSTQISPLLLTDFDLLKEADKKQAECSKQMKDSLSSVVGCNLLSPSFHQGNDKVQDSEECHGSKSVEAFHIDNGQEKGQIFCDLNKDSYSPALPPSIKAQYSCSKNHLEGAKERQVACCQIFRKFNNNDQQDSQSKSIEIQETSPITHRKLDSSSREAEMQAELDRQTGLNKDEKSNFQRGKLLALSLMQDCKILSEANKDHFPQHVHYHSSSPSRIGTLGPIGHDLEEILEVSLADLEKDIWAVEVPNSSKISEVLARHCGVLDINNFSRKYTHQRANCLRYCLAVVSGKMNINGVWVLLSKKTLSARKRHFYAVIQARTVTEAAGHARAGFQVETLNNVMEAKQIKRAEVEPKQTSPHENSRIEVDGNKENTLLYAICRKQAKPDASIKRRRLQPISTLSLHAGPDLSANLGLAETNVDEPNSQEATPGNMLGTLPLLLTGHNR